MLVEWSFVFILNFLEVLIPLCREESEFCRLNFRTVNLFKGFDASSTFMVGFVTDNSCKSDLINANLWGVILLLHFVLNRWM